MPRKLSQYSFLPPSVASRLTLWGRLIRQQRVSAKVTAKDFCSRVSISANTLRRMEAGDSSVSVGSYLIALFALGILDTTVPTPNQDFIQSVLNRTAHGSPRARVKKSLSDGEDGVDDDYF